MTWYEEDAVRDVLRDCGFDAMLEVVNRLLMSTASHQYEAGIKTGEFLERTRIETDMRAVLNRKREANE